MKPFLFPFLVSSLCLLSTVAKESLPKVQVYSHSPGEPGQANNLICHVSGFHPPEIAVELLQNGREMSDAKQNDLAFDDNWYYYLTKHVPFTPGKGEEYACRVTHMGRARTFRWDPDL